VKSDETNLLQDWSTKMAEQPKDSKAATTEAKKKQAGTVLLTPEELRAISGGAGVNPPPPVNPNPNNKPTGQ
jgi:hypothetical protein